MSGLAPDTAYEFSLQLEYQDIESSNSITGESTPTLTVTTGFNDTDGDTIGDHEDNCPDDANPSQANRDGDSAGDACDVDDDGDGLIEIATADEFNNTRHNMGGTSYRAATGEVGDATGCGGQLGISTCNGYELSADIDLKAAGYDNWEPIGGGCTRGYGNAVCSSRFDAIFEGNDHIISNLSINLVSRASGVGLFGAVTAVASLRNLTLRDVDIRSSAGGSNFGSLVGHGRGAEFHSISVENANISVRGTGDGVGGLVGDGGYADISSSSVVAGTVSGSRDVGGLVGEGYRADISSSSVVADTVSGSSSVGGLVGGAREVDISSSSVVADTVSGGDYVGGLVGYGWIAVISSSSVVVDTVSGGDYVGGLVGYARESDISSSLVLGGFINGTSHVGGIVGASGVFRGVNRDPDSVEDTYWLDSVQFTRAQPLSSNTFGEGKSASDLQAPVSFAGTGNIYANWANAWCDPATGEFTSNSTHRLATAGDTNRAWDLGTDKQYPILTCFGDKLPFATQRVAINKVLNGESPLPLDIDTDNDGYGDREDPMPNSDPADVEQGDIDGDGFFGSEDPDDDNDNHLDLADNCPNTPNPSQANADGTGTEAGNACDDTFDGTSGQAKELAALVGVTNVTLSWNNPTATAAEGLRITGIFLSRAEAGSAATRIQIAGGSVPWLGVQSVSLALGADNTYEMSGLAPDTSYEFSLQLEYQDTESSNDITGESTPSVSVTTLVADTDGDGVKDDRDNCLNTPNSDQANSDSDPLGDACDPVPNSTPADVVLDDPDGDGYYGSEDPVQNSAADDVALGDPDGDRLFGSEDPDDDNDNRLDGSDNCPLILNNDQANSDSDSAGDACDVDDDNDGLIEIDSADDLNKIRNNLAGTGLSDTLGNTGDKTGCPTSSNRSTDADGNTITTCIGYELTADISLKDYDNWDPIGRCISQNNCPESFSGTFDGNGHSISGLQISLSADAYGVGLFGAVTASASLRNITLRDVDITSGGRGSDLGALVGYGRDAEFKHISVEGLNISAAGINFVGGLVGNGEDADISSSSVVADTVSGSYSVGGLVGDGGDADISSSSVVADTVSGDSVVGGLVGVARESDISSSSVVAGTVSGDYDVGGLVGSGENVDISSSSALAGTVSGRHRVGGLVGDGEDAEISSSSVVADTVSGVDQVGGLVGGGRYADITSSSVVAGTVSGDDYVGGLVGNGADADISSSLVLGGSIDGISHVGGIVGASGRFATCSVCAILNQSPQSVDDTYWLDSVRFTDDQPLSTNTFGERKTGIELQAPTSFTGTGNIYATWTDVCNANRAWDLGGATQFPVLTCFGNEFNPSRQRYAITKVLNGESPLPLAADTDGDGYIDSEDPMPNSDPADIDLGDDDGDGYFGREDAFPNNATEHTDTDGDSFGNNIDIDDDGDGLIEVASADDLNKIRNNLAGTGLSNTPGTTGDKTGCPTEVNPGTDADGNSITACNGYELTTYIPLAHVGYTNWDPIGGCVAVNDCPNSFNGTFDGNGHSISELQISLSADAYGVGLFGAVNADASLRNLTLRDVDISSSAGGRYFGSLVGHGRGAEFHSILVDNANISVGATSVGGLVGYGVSADISSSLVVADAVSGYFSVGGLVGSGGNVDISSSSVVADTVRGSSSVGGLVGSGENVDISSSSALAGTVSGGRNVGGLVGWGRYADITSSSVVADTVSGSRDVGGLVGYGWIAVISSSSVVADTVSGDNYVGGLVGWGRYADITSSSVVAGTVSGDDYVGGLVGNGADADISSSLVLGGFINGRSHVGGLVGTGRPNSIADTYWLDSVQFTRAQPLSSNTFGEGKSASDLQAPVSFAGTGNIYANWADAWCDPETGEFTSNSTDDLATNAYRVWDLGSSTQFPVLSCFGDRLTEAAQRQKITEILDPDGDGLLGGADPVPNSDPADVALEDEDGDGYFGSEDALPNDPTDHLDGDGDLVGDSSDNCLSSPNTNQANSDSDPFGDACDVDDDGDGLIEIATADEFNNTRHNMGGTSYRAATGEVGDATGCGGQLGISTCNGYELSADIDLKAAGYDNWEPIGGGCTRGYGNAVCSSRFDAIFEGNDHIISNLSINLVSRASGVGLFGAVTAVASFATSHCVMWIYQAPTEDILVLWSVTGAMRSFALSQWIILI